MEVTISLCSWRAVEWKIIAGQEFCFFYRFYFRRFECGAAHRAGISLRATETSSASLSPPPHSSAGQLFHGAGPPCARFSSSGRVYRETINKIYTDARIYPVARSGQSGRGVKVVLPNGARYSRWYVGSKRNNIANSIRPHRTPSGL